MKELRYMTPATEIRSSANGKEISGYAAVFNVNAQLPQFQERVVPGAFTRAIRTKQDVVCLFNHDANKPLGRTTANTLQLSQDNHGLRFVCQLPNTSYANDVHTLIKSGTIAGCSFAFKIPQGGEKWSQGRNADGTYFPQRDLTDLDLLDVSPVTYPCYSGTEVDARTAVPAELRSAIEALNFGHNLGAGTAAGQFVLPKNSRAFDRERAIFAEAVRVYNKRHNTNYTVQQVQDLMDRKAVQRRQKFLRDILAD